MPQINKKDRDQLQMLAISEHIPQDSLVRIIDLFIDTADMKDLGFIVKGKIRCKRAKRNLEKVLFSFNDYLKLFETPHTNYNKIML